VGLPHRLFGVNRTSLARMLDELTQTGSLDLAVARDELAAAQTCSAGLRRDLLRLAEQVGSLDAELALLLSQLQTQRSRAAADRTAHECEHNREIAVQDQTLTALRQRADWYRSAHARLLQALSDLIEPWQGPSASGPTREETRHG